jgi:hypothetical protein
LKVLFSGGSASEGKGGDGFPQKNPAAYAYAID